MAKQYNWGNIRTLLMDGFSEDELRQFTFDEPEFKDVYDQLPENASKADIVQELLEYTKRLCLNYREVDRCSWLQLS